MNSSDLQPCPWPTDALLPHAAPMLLLDRAEAFSAVCAVAIAEIRPNHPLGGEEGVPAHIGIELMAQTCGVHVGALARKAGDPVRLGFLLGSRDYASKVASFPYGTDLRIEVTSVFSDDGMAVYACRIDIDGVVVATANLNLYQPKNLSSILGKSPR